MGLKFSNVLIVATILSFCLLAISSLLASPIETNEIINSGDGLIIQQQTEKENGNLFDLLWERDEDTPNNEKETRKKENNELLTILMEILKIKPYNKENEAKFAAYLVNSNNDTLFYQEYYDLSEYDITVNEITYIF